MDKKGFLKSKKYKRKKLVALIMSMLMMISVFQGVTYRKSNAAPDPNNFLEYVKGLEITQGSNDTGSNYKLDQQFQFNLSYDLPADTEDWSLQDNPYFSFKLSDIYAVNDSDNSVLKDFIDKADVSTPQEITKGAKVVGYYTITGGVVNIDFSTGIEDLSTGARDGDFIFSCLIDDSKFDDQGGDYTIKFDTATTPVEEKINFDPKTVADRNVDIEKSASEISADGSITYTIKVTNNNATAFDTTDLIITDTLGKNLEAPTTMNGATFTGAANGEKTDLTIKLNDASIPANQSVNITYTCKIVEAAFANANATYGKNDGLDNTIKAEDKNLPIYIKDKNQTQSTNNTIYKDLAYKTGSLLDDKTKASWTIVINNGSTSYDMAGYTFSDTLPTGFTVDIGSVKVIASGGDDTVNAAVITGLTTAISNNTTYEFPTNSTGMYTITYTTTIPTDTTPGIKTYENVAKVTDGTNTDSSPAKVHVGDKYSKKEYAGDTSTLPSTITAAQADAINTDIKTAAGNNAGVYDANTFAKEGDIILPWKTTISVPAGEQTIVYEDSISKWGNGVAFDQGSFTITTKNGKEVSVAPTYTAGYGSVTMKFTLTDTFDADDELYITYNTIGSYADLKSGERYYDNNYKLTIAGTNEDGQASVKYSASASNPDNIMEKRVDSVDWNNGVINWLIEVDCSGGVKDIQIKDVFKDMEYYGYNNYSSYKYDESKGYLAYVRYEPATGVASDFSQGEIPIEYAYDPTTEEYTYYIDFLKNDCVSFWDSNVTLDDELEGKLIISYATQVSGDYVKYNNTHLYENEATATAKDLTNQPLTGEGYASQEITTNILTKNQENRGDENSNGISYSIEVNKYNADLNVGKDYYVVEDKLPDNLILRPESVIISCGGEEYTRAESRAQVENATADSKLYYVSYEGDTITFVVPDEHNLKISYTCTMLNSSIYGNATFVNTVKLAQPYVENLSEVTNSTNKSIATSSMTVNTYNFIVQKADAYDLDKYLANAEFTINEYAYDKTTGTFATTPVEYKGTTNDKGELASSNAVDEDGDKLVMNSMSYYEISESNPPAGYETSTKVYKVVVPDTKNEDNNIPLDKYPAGVYPIVGETELLFTDIPLAESNELIITKKYADAVGDEVASYPESGAVIEIYKGNFTAAQCEAATPVSASTYVETYDKDGKSHTIKLTNLQNGDYTVYEKSAPTGFEFLDKVYHFTVADNEISWEGGAYALKQTGEFTNYQSIDNKFTINKNYLKPTGLTDTVSPDKIVEKAVFTIQKTYDYNKQTGEYNLIATPEAATDMPLVGDNAYVVEDLQPGKYAITEATNDIYINDDRFPITLTVAADGTMTAVNKEGDLTLASTGFEYSMEAANRFKGNVLTVNKTYIDKDGKSVDTSTIPENVPADGGQAKVIFTLTKNGSNAEGDVAEITTHFATTNVADKYIYEDIEPGTYTLVESLQTGDNTVYESLARINFTVDDNYRITMAGVTNSYDAVANVVNKELDTEDPACRLYLTKSLSNHSGELTTVDGSVVKFALKNTVDDSEVAFAYSKENNRWEAVSLREGKYELTETYTYPGYQSADASYVSKITFEVKEDGTGAYIDLDTIAYDGPGTKDNNLITSYLAESGNETLVMDLINIPVDNSISVTKEYYQPDKSTEMSTSPSDKAEFTLYKVESGSEKLVAKLVESSNVYKVSKLDPGIYVIRETKIPNGYTGCEDIKFTVGDDYKITVDAATLGTYTGVSGVNATVTAKNVVGNKLVITKNFYTNLGAKITNATKYKELFKETTFVLKNGSGDDITSDKLVRDENACTLTITDLNDGNYTLTESFGSNKFDGSNLGEISISVSGGKLTVVYTGSQADFASLTGNTTSNVSATLINRIKPNAITVTKEYYTADGTMLDYSDVSTKANFAVYDEDGKLVTTEKTVDANTGKYTFTNIPSGTYYIREANLAGYNKLPDLKVVIDDIGIISSVEKQPDAISKWDSISTYATTDNTATAIAKNYQKSNDLLVIKTYKDANGNDVAGSGATFSLVGNNTTITLTERSSGAYEAKNIPTGIYTLKETAPAGYAEFDGTITVTIDSDMKLTMTKTVNAGANSSDCTISGNNSYKGEIQLVNRAVANSVTINKSYITATGEDIPLISMENSEYAEFKLYHVVGNVETEITDTDKLIIKETEGVYKFANLNPGDYIIRETAGAGFDTPAVSTVNFKVDIDGKIIYISGNATGNELHKQLSITNKRKPFDNEIKLDKIFVNSKGVEVTDAAVIEALLKEVSFVMKDADGNVVAKTPDANTSVTVLSAANLEPGVYTIEETSCPTGYDMAGKITLTVEKKAPGVSELIFDYDGQAADFTTIAINGNDEKQRIGLINHEKTGAAFAIDKKFIDYTKSEITDASKIAEYIADTKFSMLADGATTPTELTYDAAKKQYIVEDIKVGTYTITESSHANFTAISDITLVVAADGTVTVTYGGDAGDIVVDKSADGKTAVATVKNYIKGMNVNILKVDASDNKPLTGATLIIKEELTGNQIDTWVSASGVHKIDVSTLTPDMSYVLSEKEAPEGYSVATDIVFKVDAYGILYVKGSDGTFEAKTDNTITMKDDKIVDTPAEVEPPTEDTPTEEPPKDTSSSGVQTGDDTPIAQVAIIMIVALLGVFVLLTFKKKLRHN